MAREPDDRYQTAIEFQQDLQSLSGRVPGMSIPVHAADMRSPSRVESGQAQRAFLTTRRSEAVVRRPSPVTLLNDSPRSPSRPPPPQEARPASFRAPSVPPRPQQKVARGFDDIPTDVEPPISADHFQVAGSEEDATTTLDHQAAPDVIDADIKEEGKTEVMSLGLQIELTKASQRPPRPRR